MDSNFLMNYHQQPQDGVTGNTEDYPVPGLARYRSAPSSCISDFVIWIPPDFDFLSRPSSPETQRILQRFISGTAESMERAVQSGNEDLPMMTMKREETEEGYGEQGRNGYMAMCYVVAGGGTEATRVVPTKGGYVPSRLARHSSSPAGLFDDIEIEAFAGHKASRFNGTMSPIHEIGRKNMAEKRANSSSYLPGHPISSHDGLMNSGELFSERRSGSDAEVNTLSGQIAEELDEEEKRRTRPLAHHLSLPPKKKKKTSVDTTDMAIEGFLQLQQESVPCKVRAKRGCATHPRSIAERVRRTKISERIRKLQELVPNMDKQTNTADMLGLAVDYIKELQGQVKTLSENQARCRCSNNEFL